MISKLEKYLRFLMLEGLYINSGEICPLREMIALRQQYKLRIFLDETCAYGTLGATGRGSIEHWDVEVRYLLPFVSILSLDSFGGPPYYF